MALVERTTTGPFTVLPDGHIEVRRDTVIVDDATGEVKAGPTFWRGVLEPGERDKAVEFGIAHVADAIWTEDVLSDWAASVAARNEQETE